MLQKHRFVEASTDKDKQGYTDAMKYISEFDKMVKEDANTSINTVKVIKNTNYYEDVVPETVETAPGPPTQNNDFDEILNAYDEESQKKKALNSL